MSKVGRCDTCAHDGCCDDLHYCGGLRWVADDEGGAESDSDPWEGYDEREAMEERGWATQALWDARW